MERLRKKDAKDMVAYFENRKKEAKWEYSGVTMKEPWDNDNPETIQKVIDIIKKWGRL